jgi:DNA-binding Lrp family transcriptional regulator
VLKMATLGPALLRGAPDRRDVSSRAALVQRIEAEFREMPGLCITLRQASRLFGLSEEVCQRVLCQLAEGNVIQRAGSYYGALRKDFVATNFIAHNLNRHYR